MTCPTCHKTRAAVFSMLAGGEDRVVMTADHTHKVGGIHIKYLAGETYNNVPAVVISAIVAAKAGYTPDA